MKRAIFPGSFDPFTIGHKSIVDRALASLCDEVVIAIGVNAKKMEAMPEEERSLAEKHVEEKELNITKLYSEEQRVKVVRYACLTADFAKEIEADFILRGVRSVMDFEYERNIAEVNRRLTGIETVLLFTEPELACVSSSIVRELESYGRNFSDFVSQTR